MNSKNLIIPFVVLLFIQYLPLKAQKSKKEIETNQPSNTSNTDNSYTLEEKILKESLRYGDLNVAKQSLYKMIALRPENKSLKDSLAYIYINLGLLQQAILISREILETTPENQGILEVKAIAEQNLGLAKEALTSYESLYTKSKNVFHLYQIATLQYELKRLAECNASIDAMLGTADIDKKEINIGTGNRNQQQRIILKAAALNMKGVLALDLNENAIAKVCFDEALKLSPDFVLAKNNVDFLANKTKANQPAENKNTTNKSSGNIKK